MKPIERPSHPTYQNWCAFIDSTSVNADAEFRCRLQPQVKEWDSEACTRADSNICSICTIKSKGLKLHVSNKKQPRIVCLCGSGRFKDAFEEAEYEETLAGRIVLTIGCNTKDIARSRELAHHKPMLDELHLRKIDLADEVLILNVGGYIGESTHNELQYALEHGKRVRYAEVDSFGVPLDYIPDGGTR